MAAGGGGAGGFGSPAAKFMSPSRIGGGAAGGVGTPGGGNGKAGLDMLSTLAVGSGVDALRSALPEEPAVCFALARFEFGTGTFKRNKMVFLTLPLEGIPTVAKARIMGRKGDVKKALGETHAELTFESRDDVTVERVLTDLRVIAADSLGTTSIAKLREDYEAMIAAAMAHGGGAAGGRKLDLVKGEGRKTAAELGVRVRSHQALEAVREPLGVFNWASFLPTAAGEELQMANAGSLSVNEAKRWLKEDQAVFGILRVAFGSGRFRRTKFVFFSWAGPRLSVVARAKAASCKAAMKAALGPVSFDLQLTSPEDLSVATLIEKVKTLPGIEGETVTSANEASMENFVRALEEEARAAGAFFGDDGVTGAGGAVPAPTEALDEVRRGTCQWALFKATL